MLSLPGFEYSSLTYPRTRRSYEEGCSYAAFSDSLDLAPGTTAGSAWLRYLESWGLRDMYREPFSVHV
jgi:hypothetical protein